MAQTARVRAGVPCQHPKQLSEPELLQALAAVVSYHDYEQCRAKFVHAVLSTDAGRYFSSTEVQHKAGAALEMYIKSCKGGSGGWMVPAPYMCNIQCMFVACCNLLGGSFCHACQQRRRLALYTDGTCVPVVLVY